MFSKINAPSSFVTLPLAIVLSAAFNNASGQYEMTFALASKILPSTLFCACEDKKENIRKGISK